MKVEFFFGVAGLLLSLAMNNAGVACIGGFFILLVAVEKVPAWIRHEVRMYRRVVKHDFDQVGLAHIDDRRAA